MSHFEPDMSISPKITSGTTAVLGIVSKYWATTCKIQNTILKLPEPFRLQIQFLQLIQYFP